MKVGIWVGVGPDSKGRNREFGWTREIENRVAGMGRASEVRGAGMLWIELVERDG